MKQTLILFIAFINLIACEENNIEDVRIFNQSLGNISSQIPDFRTASFNVYLTFGVQAKKDAIEKHVVRSNADIVTFTETNAADFTYVQSQYTQYGFTDFRQATGTGDFLLMFMSKFPITYNQNVTGGGFDGLYCEMTIDGKTIGVLSIHTYPDCLSTPCRSSWDQPIIEPGGWNRMVQMYNYAEFFNARKIANPSVSGFIIQGDFNEDPNWNSLDEYTNFESGGYTKPSFLSYPIDRTLFPNTMLDWYNGIITVPNIFDLEGGRNTIWTLDPNPSLTVASKIDYICYTDALQLIKSEILNSETDSQNGMSKTGAVLLTADSRTASDHKFMMADFKIN